MNDTFKINKDFFANKNLLILGDSVSAQATIGNNKTYSTLLKEELNINELKNAAIGGTTLTYMYEGSNIYKEYKDNAEAIDGCRVVTNLSKNNELSKFDYVIIAYGHNDQYFQPPLDEENTNPLALNDIHSFKNSYRYIIKTLKEANKNVNIIILNCTYSEYDIVNPTKYDGGLKYSDYRNASKEIADEYKLKYIDPWNYMRQFFDYNTNKFYYQDSVHLSKNGHIELFKYLLNK